MGCWLVTGNEHGARRSSTDASLRIYCLGVPCFMYYWKHDQSSIVTNPVTPQSMVMYAAIHGGGPI